MNKDALSTVGLDDFVKAVEQNKCPFCAEKIVIKEFRDLMSLREFELSGICQKCQDKTFVSQEEE